MNLNELITKHNFISQLILKGRNDADEISKELKVKIVKIRIKLFKYSNEFEKDAQEAFKELTPPVLDELLTKKKTVEAKGEKLTDEEETKLKDMIDKRTDEYKEYLNSRGLEEIPEKIESDITADEFYNQILPVNINNDVVINNQKIPASTFLEIFYGLFVKNDLKVVDNKLLHDTSKGAVTIDSSVDSSVK